MNGPELVVDVSNETGEGPLWHAGSVWWVDIPPGVLHRYDPHADSLSTTPIGRFASALAPRPDGSLVCAVKDGFVVIGEDGSVSEWVSHHPEDFPARTNDAAVDAHGRFWFGRVPLDFAGERGALYTLDLDGTIALHLDGVRLPNGIDWSPDGRTMYFVDSLRFTVHAFEVSDDGALGGRRDLVSLPHSWDPLTVPDGLTVDGEGHLWVALWGGSSVVRFTPDGERVDAISLPVSKVTSCAFGGADLTDLYITTAATEGEPGSGGLWRARPGVRGRPTNVFGR
ncbi:MAG TPA: SMP-30/gluconolactonase/LRE family protein [Actinomycetota bacterium]|nr:SMP-30/gluconolactonase/LRE family protein [Actinomycetota bacterium]